MVRVGGRVIEVGNISSGLKVQLPPSTITFKSLEIIGGATYPPHYLKKSLDFLAANINRLPLPRNVRRNLPTLPRRRGFG